jgi:hypothetical protein
MPTSPDNSTHDDIKALGDDLQAFRAEAKKDVEETKKNLDKYKAKVFSGNWKAVTILVVLAGGWATASYRQSIKMEDLFTNFTSEVMTEIKELKSVTTNQSGDIREIKTRLDYQGRNEAKLEAIEERLRQVEQRGKP